MDHTKDPVRAALTKAVTQNEHDMLLTGEECREIRSILAAIPHSEQREMVAAGEPIYQVLCKRMIGGDQWEDVKKSEYDMWIAQRVPCRVVYAAPVAAPTPEARQHVHTWKHAANEWADTAYNGLQHLRNIEDVLAAGRAVDVKAARENMEACCKHARGVADKVYEMDKAASVPEAKAEQVERCKLRLCCKADAHVDGCDTYDKSRNADEFAAPAVKHEAVADADQLNDWLALICDNGYAMGDRLQRLMNSISLLLDGKPITRHVIREQAPHEASELPPLPPEVLIAKRDEFGDLWAHTADQLRAYGQACRQPMRRPV